MWVGRRVPSFSLPVPASTASRQPQKGGGRSLWRPPLAAVPSSLPLRPLHPSPVSASPRERLGPRLRSLAQSRSSNLVLGSRRGAPLRLSPEWDGLAWADLWDCVWFSPWPVGAQAEARCGPHGGTPSTVCPYLVPVLLQGLSPLPGDCSPSLCSSPHRSMSPGSG